METLVEKVLKVLQHEAEITVDLLGSFLLSKSETRKDFKRFLNDGPRRFKTDWAEAYKKRKQYHNTLAYLLREGLVEKTGKNKNVLWSITKRGLEKFKTFNKQRANPLSAVNSHFSKPAGSGFTIVIFDIPERERRKRAWLRLSLNNMDFRYLQKSVWIGKGKIDESFVHALKERNMFDYIHIFSINSSGTIGGLRP